MGFDYEDDIGYDVEEIGAVASTLMNRAKLQGVSLPRSAAMNLASRRLVAQAPRASLVRQAMAVGSGSGMTTSCPLGTATFAAATPAGTIVNLAARSEEPFVATKIIIQRANYAAVPPAVCAGIPVLVLDVRVGQRSVLANGAGGPVEAFDPAGTGGQSLAGGVVIQRSTLITIQFQLGAIPIPAGENLYLTAVVYGKE